MADFDADEHSDLAALDSNARTVWLRFGDGTGRFARPRAIEIPALTEPTQPVCGDGGKVAADCAGRFDVPNGLVAADVDGDGRLDLVTGTSHGNSVAVLRGDSRGDFEAQRRYEVGAPVWDVLIGDLDGDGAVEVVAVGSELRVLRNNGRGDLALTPTRLSGLRAPVLGDADGDGDLDLLALRGLPKAGRAISSF